MSSTPKISVKPCRDMIYPPPDEEMLNSHNSKPGSNFKVLYSKTHLISERVNELFKNERWADIEFIVGDDDNKENFRAHKIILASSSPVFEAMCFGPMAEKGVIEIPDIKPEIFKELLSFIYLDHFEVTSPLTACRILYAAKKYLVTELSNLCKNYLKSNMRTGDICLVYEYLRSIDEMNLAQNALVYICHNTSKIFRENSFLMLKVDTIKSILNESTLAIYSEKEVLDVVLRWTDEECKRRGLEDSKVNLRNVIDPLLSSICFLSFDCHEFVNKEELRNIFTPEEYRDILCNIVKRDSCPLPPNFNPMSRICVGFSNMPHSGINESDGFDSNPSFSLNSAIVKSTDTLFQFSANEQKTCVYCKKSLGAKYHSSICDDCLSLWSF